MKLQVLLSAMYLDGYDYINSLHISGDCLVINQCDNNCTEHIPEGFRTITYIETTERGLSKSRNMAIENATADICILCDNDVEYVENYESLIGSAFRDYPDADIIIFFIKRKEKPTPNYSSIRNMNYLSVMKIFSPEIAFRRQIIKEKQIKFHELFGAGAHYYMGEENIFLYDCLRAGLKIKYIPVKIAELRETQSTWFTGYEEHFFVSRGANYCAMTKGFSWFLILQFAIRKKALYAEKASVWKAIRLMLKGRKEYIVLCKEKQTR